MEVQKYLRRHQSLVFVLGMWPLSRDDESDKGTNQLGAFAWSNFNECYPL